MKVKMYKAVDTLGNEKSLFAISGNEMAVSTDFGENDPWLSEDGFGDFNSYIIEDYDESRMINPVLIWESDDANQRLCNILPCICRFWAIRWFYDWGVYMILILALICAVIALEAYLKLKQYNYTTRKEIDHIRAMRGF